MELEYKLTKNNNVIKHLHKERVWLECFSAGAWGKVILFPTVQAVFFPNSVSAVRWSFCPNTS